jgi:hypothetical protein
VLHLGDHDCVIFLKNDMLESKCSDLCKKSITTLICQESSHFRPKKSKVAEISDYNIGPTGRLAVDHLLQRGDQGAGRRTSASLLRDVQPGPDDRGVRRHQREQRQQVIF